jgi:hypothetical protein
MEIEITMTQPNKVSNEVQNEVQNEILNEVSNVVLNEVSNEVQNEVQNEILNEVSNVVTVNDVILNEVSLEASDKDDKDIQHIKKDLTQEDITIIINNVINDICNYLSENTEFVHMNDNIINARAREVIRNKYEQDITKSISDFIIFLNTDETIQEYITENAKLIYDINNSEDIHVYIFNKIYLNIDYANTIAQGWFNWDSDKKQYTNIYTNPIEYVLTNKIIQYVFQQYNDSNSYEFMDTYDEEEEENGEENEEENEEENDEEDEEEDDEENEKDNSDISLRSNGNCTIF